MDRGGDIDHGLELMSRLGEVMPDQAGEGVTAVYQDVRGRLRVPFVNFLFRELANYPEYLRFAWNRVSPSLLTADFERAADELRALALVEPIPEGPNFGWMEEEDLKSVRAFTDTIHYVLPKLLLVATAFDEGLGGAPGLENSATDAVEPGVAGGAFTLPMVSSEDADAELAALFGRIRDRHDHPDVASYYRGLGNWPWLLGDLWARLEPFVGSEPFEGRKQELLRRSSEVATRMPLPRKAEVLDLGLDEEDVRDLRGMLAVFRFRVVPDTFLEVSVIKAMLDGRDSALASRFSFV